MEPFYIRQSAEPMDSVARNEWASMCAAEARQEGALLGRKTFNEHTPYPMKHEPSGTNLFGYDDAVAMVRHMLDGLPKDFGRPFGSDNI